MSQASKKAAVQNFPAQLGRTYKKVQINQDQIYKILLNFPLTPGNRWWSIKQKETEWYRLKTKFVKIWR